MADRMIRDEIRRSHRYVHLPSDTHRVLFLHLILDADDFGNTEGDTVNLTMIMFRPVSEELASSWLSTLADVDLIRVYLIDGKRYIHIPRYRQRLRSVKGKHPRPPKNIECKEIRDLEQNDGHMTDICTSHVGRREGKGREVIKPRSNAEPVDKWWKTETGFAARANELGIQPRPGEATKDYRDRVFKANEQAKTSKT